MVIIRDVRVETRDKISTVKLYPQSTCRISAVYKLSYSGRMSRQLISNLKWSLCVP